MAIFFEHGPLGHWAIDDDINRKATVLQVSPGALITNMDNEQVRALEGQTNLVLFSFFFGGCSPDISGPSSKHFFGKTAAETSL